MTLHTCTCTRTCIIIHYLLVLGGISKRVSGMEVEFGPTHPRRFTAATCILLLPTRQFGTVRSIVLDDETFIMFRNGT
jgi:hypothetical protein